MFSPFLDLNISHSSSWYLDVSSFEQVLVDFAMGVDPCFRLLTGSFLRTEGATALITGVRVTIMVAQTTLRTDTRPVAFHFTYIKHFFRCSSHGCFFRGSNDGVVGLGHLLRGCNRGVARVTYDFGTVS